MDKDPPSTGPDVAVVGAARSGTTYLAAQLAAHPMIDAPAVKEPNFYSRYLDKGEAWYDDLFPPRAPGHLRLDASVSYTFPHFPDALAALAKASPTRRSSTSCVTPSREPSATTSCIGTTSATRRRRPSALRSIAQPDLPRCSEIRATGWIRSC